ncbi:MAG: hypothetical protein IKQ77_07885 [Prevotella sp.]|nr:hypothetical protein [Prevotella sp.]
MKAKQKTKHDAKFLLSFPRKSSEKHYLCGKNKKREMNDNNRNDPTTPTTPKNPSIR